MNNQNKRYERIDPHPAGAEYVPMLQHSFAAYRALEREAKAPAGRFYTQTGVLNAGALVAAARRAAEAHGLAHEVMDAAEAMARFPGARRARA